MRTTITLDPDTRALIERAMRERDLTFKEAVNEGIRAGFGRSGEDAPVFSVPRALGPARVDLTHALRIAGELEDDTLARRTAEGR